MQFIRSPLATAAAACVVGAVAPSTGAAQLINDAPDAVAGAVAFSTCSRVYVSGMTVEQAKYMDAAFMREAGMRNLEENVYIGTLEDYPAEGMAMVYAAVSHDGQTVGSRLALYEPGHGCLPLVDQYPSEVLASRLPAPDYTPNEVYFRWPVGTASAENSLPAALRERLASAVDPLFTTYQGPEIDFRELGDYKTLSVAIAKDGDLVYERYLGDEQDVPVDENTSLIGFSMTKTVLSLALGAWVTDTMDSQGVPHSERAAWIESFLDQPAPVPEGGMATNTYRELLQMQTDLACFDPVAAPKLLFGHGDTALAASNWNRTDRRGNYCSASSVLLSWALQDAIGGREATLDYLKSQLFEPAHVTTASFPRDETGTLQGASSLHMTTRDWLRMGQLFMDDGRVDATRYSICQDLQECGEEVIAPEWMDFMRKPAWRKPVSVNDILNGRLRSPWQYAGHVWKRTFEVPDDEQPGQTERVQAYVFVGLGHQRIFVIPDRNVVFARLAADFDSRGGSQTAASVRAVLNAFNPLLN